MDAALINWARHREVGLETTWQFPATPPFSLSPTVRLSLSLWSEESGQVGCWEEWRQLCVDIPLASSLPLALHSRRSLWQCLAWL